MSPNDILMSKALESIVYLTHQCKTENGIEDDDLFVITEIIGNFEQVKVKNQYDQTYIINSNQLIPKKR